jgi:predicted ArsR family transcriptional regulator
MISDSAAVSGHKGLRGQVLIELKKSQPVTAKELGWRFAVSANAVRRHLKELEAEGLVEVGREQHGLGAPTHVYRLSEHGEALFPNGYRDALLTTLELIEAKDGRAGVVRLFEARYAALAERLRAELAVTPPDRRLAVVARALSEAGYMAEWEADGGTFRLAEHNCAMRAVVERFPELCAVEERFLEDVLGAEVQRREHIVRGCNSCEYAISFADGERRPAGERIEV